MTDAAKRPHLGPPESFPMMLKAFEAVEQRHRGFKIGLEMLRTGLQAGEIANARYNDAKHYLSRAVEDAWRYWFYDQWPHGVTEGMGWEFSWKNTPSYVGIADIARLPKKMDVLRKMEITNKQALKAIESGERLAKEMTPIHEAFAWLKTRCVKLKRTKDAVSPEEILPQATLAARKLVHDVMATALEQIRSDYLAYMKVLVCRQAERFGDEIKREDRESLAYANPRMIAAAFESVSGGSNVLYRRRRDAKSSLEKLAEKLVEEVFRGFLTKNVEKIAAIVELKGSENPGIELKQAEVQGQSLVTAMEFTFADGSSFEARNSIVHQYSGHGKPYVRFPTTFHNVVMANGDAMKTPSEEEMKTTFVENAVATSMAPGG